MVGYAMLVINLSTGRYTMNELRTNQIDEYHQSNNLPETRGGLGKRKQLCHHTIPQQLANKGKKNGCNHKRKKNCDSVSIHFTFHIGGRIGESFDCSAASRKEGSRHVSNCVKDFVKWQ